MIYLPGLTLPTPVPEPVDLAFPAQEYERKRIQSELDQLLGGLDAPITPFSAGLEGVRVDKLDDAALARLFGSDIAPPLAPPGGEDAEADKAQLFPPAPFDALQRSVRPGMNELSRYGYDAAFSDPYGADLRNELRTLVRNAPIQGI